MYLRVRVHVYLHVLGACVPAGANTCVRVCLRLRVHVHVCGCTNVSVCFCLCVCVCVCVAPVFACPFSPQPSIIPLCALHLFVCVCESLCSCVGVRVSPSRW
jgi:hypothetical protein